MLDDPFGPVEAPQRPASVKRRHVELWKANQPISLIELDSVTAGSLKVYMDQVEKGFAISVVLGHDTRVPWLITSIGRLLVAVEEPVYDQRSTSHPKHRRHPNTLT